MSSKHFINDPTHLVLSALKSITYTNPNTALDAVNKIIYLRPDATPKAQKVAVVSGGGSGHEPSFAGYVGPGFLTASVAGTIFASPSSEQLRACLMHYVGKPEGGILMIMMNYTGDIMNAGVAIEKAKAAGRECEMVIVGDDAAIGRRQGGKVGRRGIAGTVIVQKIASALAASGATLSTVARAARIVAENTVSVGSSLGHVHVPGRAEEAEELQKHEVELGFGIHNEAGSERMEIDLSALVKTMLRYMLNTEDKDRGFVSINSSDPTIIMVNNLGALSVLEMGGITHEVIFQLEHDYNIRPVRTLSGTFMTSLAGQGFSITLVKAVDLDSGISFLDLFDATVEVPGWSASVSSKTWSSRPTDTYNPDTTADAVNEPCGINFDPERAKKALEHALNRVIKAEPEITKYDTVVGDGDCGTGLKRGAEGILKHLAETKPEQDVGIFLDGIISVVEATMDGTSGALYAIFLNALASGIRQQSDTEPVQANAGVWSEALNIALDSLGRYTPARPGDRTLIDALSPFVDELQQSGDVCKAAQAAEAGARKTKGMKASLGRTVYVGGSGVDEVPDPGAYALAEIFSGLADGLQQSG